MVRLLLRDETNIGYCPWQAVFCLAIESVIIDVSLLKSQAGMRILLKTMDFG